MIKSQKKFNSLSIYALAIFVMNCAPTTNYYTGKTLESGKGAMVSGLDAIYVQASDDDAPLDESKPPFVTSFGYSRGLPHKFEAGLRYFPPAFVEGILRYEITSQKSSIFHLSLNSHIGKRRGLKPYVKYGLTSSTEFYGYEPFLSYYRYSKLNKPDYWTDWLEGIQVITYGITIPIPGGHLIPEFNYQFAKSLKGNGVMYFGVGLRIGGDE